MARGKRSFGKCVVTNSGYYKDWNPSTISSRVSANGGRYSQKLTEQTTHLVVTQKAWRAQGSMVKEALAYNQENPKNKPIKIVSFDWLDDRWNGNSMSRNDNIYLWERLEPIRSGASKKSQKNAITDDEEESSRSQTVDSGRTKENEGAKTHAGMIGEVLQESTEQYVDERAKKAIDKKVEAQRRVREEMEAEERREKNLALKAATFQKGAKKARNEIFSENHHIYADETGFKYEVVLTKVQTKYNRNERLVLTLQIYESNVAPYTYAMNAQFAGTSLRPANNVMAAIGCSFSTAFHAFKTVFKEKTRVEWDHRISAAIERKKRDKRNRGQGTGSPEGTQRGVPVSENDAAAQSANLEEEEDFATAPFQYDPPSYGPRGTLPHSEVEKVPPDRHQEVDRWMSEANGAEKESVSKSKDAIDTVGANGEFDFNQPGMFPAMNSQYQDQGRGSGCMLKDKNGEIDLTGAYDYPFTSDEPHIKSHTTVRNDVTQQVSFENILGVQDGLNFDTQHIGETQIAEKVRGELEEFIDGAGNSDLSNDSGGGEASYGFGSSILGKRKRLSMDGSQERPKTVKMAEVEGGFSGQESAPGAAGDPIDTGELALFGWKEDNAVDTQIQTEMAAGETVQTS